MEIDKDFLLRAYGDEWGPEACEWNTSVQSKYLEYKIAQFFEDNFLIPKNAEICNVGIGVGDWDRYLSYRLNGGCLTSIDIDEDCCRQLSERLINERNKNNVIVICSDILNVNNMNENFDIITLIGSARLEIGIWDKLFEKLSDMLKPDGYIYYMEIHEDKPCDEVNKQFADFNLEVSDMLCDNNYGFNVVYRKIRKKDNC